MYEFNPALSRHGLLFQARGRHDAAAAARRYIRGEFCSANALQGTDPAVARPSDFSFAILIKGYRKEVLAAVQSLQETAIARKATMEKKHHG